MGRIFEVRKATMFARWDKMAKQFTRVGRQINMAVKAGGPDPENNPMLRRCIANAKGVNMPKDKIEGAIKRASNVDTQNFSEVVYEGYAPHGVAVLVETATDNPNRTVANIRMYFNRAGGNLSTSGALNFVFERVGEFVFQKSDIEDPEAFELQLIDYGLKEMGEGDDEKYVVRTTFSHFGEMSDYFSTLSTPHPLSQEVSRIPTSTVSLSEEQANEVLAMVDKMEQDDDVQKVYHNLV